VGLRSNSNSICAISTAASSLHFMRLLLLHSLDLSISGIGDDGADLLGSRHRAATKGVR
jgi:hypothetical protein